MKFNTYILIILLIFCSVAGVCLASEAPHAQLFTAFYLDSALGTRALADQSAVTMEATQGLQPRKSPNEAFLYSLIVPGMGQLYTGAKRGYVYMAAEVGLLTTYFILRHSASNTREDYRDIVREHVNFIGAGSFEDWDPIEDFEHASQYETWNNPYSDDKSPAGKETLKRTGKWYWKDIDPDLKNQRHGDFESGVGSEIRLEAFELRQKANDTFERAKFFLGMAILNHVISAVEARITTKHFNTRLQNTSMQTKTAPFEIDVQTDISGGTLAGTLVLRKRF